MKSLAFVGIVDYVTLGVLFLLLVLSIVFFLGKTRKKFSQNAFPNAAKVGWINAIAGLLVMALSIVWLLHIEKDIDQAMGLVQPVSIMTSRPLVMASIALFLAGLASVIIGVQRLILSQKTKKSS